MHLDMYNKFLKDSFDLVISEKKRKIVKKGFLKKDARIILVNDFIPRFYSENYCDSFSVQWSKFRNVQLDSQNGYHHSFNRLFGSTKWTMSELKGKSVLECGCGPGRFTEIFLKAGADVVSVDMSMAIDVNRENNGERKNLLLMQGDITNLPFFYRKFDYVFCHGVLQHTPDPEFTFNCLVRYLKKGGKISIDSYRRVLIPTGWSTPKYIWRPITKRMDKERLLGLLKWYIPKYINFDSVIRGVPKIGVVLTGLIPVPCWNYLDKGYTREERIEHAIMDTFDALSPTYDNPKTIKEIRKFFKGNDGLKDVDVFGGYNGVVGNGVRK